MEISQRATFLCTNTAAFHPPHWACMPVDANSHARLDAFRDNRHCATYMVATQCVNLFGRDQESCDHVLGNPSISRKHAAVIHDNEGGIYIVDLMSRHGTYVGRKKIPPHDPYLIHDGDIIRFGQSVRVYIFKGAASDGNSAPVKKSWRRKFRVSRVSISAVVPKKSPSKPKASSKKATKLVNAVCYGTLKDEKVVKFITGVLELGDNDRQGVADTLVERLQAKFEFHATQVHRNAFIASMALLKQNLCVEEFEENLDVFIHISQQRNDNIYRADARKFLQAIAAVRLDPDNPQFNGADSAEEDVGSACPPTANNRESRERSISDEGNNLASAGDGVPRPCHPDSVGLASELERNRRDTIGYNDHRYQPSHCSSSNENEDESCSSATGNGYAPPDSFVVDNGSRTRIVNSGDSLGFDSIDQSAPEADEFKGSAFGFIADSDPTDDVSSRSSSTDRRSGHSAFGFAPPRPSVSADNFLLEYPSMDNSAFENMWELANGESDEWSVDLGSVDAHELDPRDLQAFLQPYRMICVSSEKVAGQQQWFFVAEQVCEGTIFLVNISVMPGLSDMSVTLKWIVNSLLYRNGHVIFMEILKYALYQFAENVQVRVGKTQLPPHQMHYRDQEPESGQSHVKQNGREPEPVKVLRNSYTASQTASRTASHATSGDGGDEVEDADEEAMSARDYLCESPAIDVGKFEQVWATATEIALLSYTLNELPEVDEVIEHFRNNCMSCLASGNVDKLVKFFFFAEMTEIQCVFCVEISFSVDTGALEGTVKRLAIRKHREEEEEQIGSSFVSFIEKVIHDL